MMTRATLIFLIAAAGSVALTGCSPSETGLADMAPPKVTVAYPLKKDVVDASEFTGRTQALESVDVRARVQGFLRSVEGYLKDPVKDFEEGTIVEKDAVLFIIEPEPYQAELAVADAAVAQAKAARQLADANLARAEQLIKTRTISAEEFQTKQAEQAVAAAEVLATEASLEQARINLNYTVIRSPVRGRIGRRLVDPGNLVGGAEQTLLTTIVSLDPMYVYFDVAERDLLRYLRWKQEQEAVNPKAERKVLMRLEDETEFTREGYLDFLDNRVDPNTGTALLRGVFPNKDDVLRDGMNAWIRIPTAPIPDAVLVDDRAIGTDLGGKYVLVLGKDNVVELAHVELGRLIDGMRVVRSGLSAEQRYIVNGMQRARPGLPVEPQMAEKKPAPKPAKPVEGGDAAKPRASSE